MTPFKWSGESSSAETLQLARLDAEELTLIQVRKDSDKDEDRRDMLRHRQSAIDQFFVRVKSKSDYAKNIKGVISRMRDVPFFLRLERKEASM